MKLVNILKSLDCNSDSIEDLIATLDPTRKHSKTKDKALVQSEIVGSFMIQLIETYGSYYIAGVMKEICISITDEEIAERYALGGTVTTRSINNVIKSIESAFLISELLTSENKEDIQSKLLGHFAAT